MKKNLLSKLGLLVLCFGLAASFTACSGGDDTSTQTEEETESDGAEGEETAE